MGSSLNASTAVKIGEVVASLQSDLIGLHTSFYFVAELSPTTTKGAQLAGMRVNRGAFRHQFGHGASEAFRLANTRFMLHC
jgi:hypothetical protein